MSKPEVAGLQALAQKNGKQLTRNPTTGLLEAGVLDSILPMIAGGTAAAFGFDPMTAAALVGGGTTLLSGGNLQKGLMAGLGAYGGAGLASGLMESGASTLAGNMAPSSVISAAPTPVAAATPAATTAEVAKQMSTPGFLPSNNTSVLDKISATGAGNLGEAQAQAAYQQSLAQAAERNAIAAAPTKAASAVEQAAMQGPSAIYAPGGAYTQALQQTPGASMMQGFKNLGNDGGISDLARRLGGNMGALKYVGAAAAPVLMDMSSSDLSAHSAASDAANTIRPYKFSQYHDPNAPINSRTPYFTQTMTPLPTYVAPYAGGGMAHGPARGESLRGTMGMLHGTERLMNYAAGGISNLGSYSDGGQLLRGPGDGVSDDIPAQIGQHQPARLAEGEFVVPARIVSELGNGSTNAGAKRLYDMMNRIQAGRAKTMGGKSAYAKDTNAEQHLPA